MLLTPQSPRLSRLIQEAPRPEIVVVGDAILDRYLYGSCQRLSQEAPVPVFEYQSEQRRLGGAANVAASLARLEARVRMLTVMGDDCGPLMSQLANASFEVQGFREEGRPTTTKTRYCTLDAQRRPHHLLRHDLEDRRPPSCQTENDVAEAAGRLIAGHPQAVVISDYGKGMLTPWLTQRMIDQANELGVPVLVDPAPGVQLMAYRRAKLLKLNRREAQQALGWPPIDTTRDALLAAQALREKYEFSHVVVTLDVDGMVLVSGSGLRLVVPTQQREVLDIAGAGDAVLALLALGLACDFDLDDSCRLANVAAGLTLSHLGVWTLTRQDLIRALRQEHARATKLATPGAAREMIEELRRQRKRIVLTNGCFDLLHPGHVQLLQEAAQLGDLLVVAVNSDESVRRLKGPTRPVQDEYQRVAMLSSLASVGLVVVMQEDTPHALLELLRPDVLVKGGTTEEVVGREVVEGYGGQVVKLGAIPGLSTTAMMTRIHDTLCQHPSGGLLGLVDPA